MKYKTYKLTFDENVEITIPENFKDCLTLIRSDFFRIYGRIVSNTFILKRMLCHPFASTLIWFRLSNYGGARKLFYPFRLLYRMCCSRNCIAFPFTTKVGYGLYIGHGISFVINNSAVIGNNVNLSHYVSIGANMSKAAIIGNSVYIGPQSCLIENVRIGHSSIIGAGAIVTKDVPANSVAVGVPAKSVTQTSHKSFINNPWPYAGR